MFKKMKRLLAVFCAVLLVVGSCMTVSAAVTYFSECPVDLSKFSGMSHDYVFAVESLETGSCDIYTSSVPFILKTASVGSDALYTMQTQTGQLFNCGHGIGFENIRKIFPSSCLTVAIRDGICVYTSHDIYFGGELVFQVPPEPEAEKQGMSQWILPIVSEVQIQAKTITIVAVFCLALLVGLTILSKKLRIFLPS